MQAQARICPTCYDDHWPDRPCKESDLKDRIATLESQLAEAERTIKELGSFIAINGYRRCDIPACNCGSYHGGLASDRLRELGEVLGLRTQGVAILEAVEKLIEAEAERDEARRVAVFVAQTASRFSGHEIFVGTYPNVRPIDHDGTDADIYRALREAMGEE